MTEQEISEIVEKEREKPLDDIWKDIFDGLSFDTMEELLRVRIV
jgi:hypothetical protein